MGNARRTSITGSVRCYGSEKEEADSASILIEVSSEGDYGISSDLAKSLFGNTMTAVLRGYLPSKPVTVTDQATVKAVKTENK